MITVPKSVLAYHTQPDVETAIDLLLASKKDTVPAALKWHEVSAFYRATLAARQTPIEFALFLEAVWRAVWSEVPPLWKPCDASHPTRPDLSVKISTVWEESCFSRRFEYGSYSLELSVGLWPEEGLQLGIVLYDKSETMLLTEALMPGWVGSIEFDTVWTPETVIALGDQISTTAFTRWTDQAWEAVRAAIAGDA